MSKILTNNLSTFNMSLIGSLLLLGTTCSSSSAVILGGSGIDFFSRNNVSAFIQWRWEPNNRIDTITYANRYWAVNFNTRRTSTILNINYRVDNHRSRINLGRLELDDIFSSDSFINETREFLYEETYDIFTDINPSGINTIEIFGNHSQILPPTPSPPPVSEPMTLVGSISTLIAGFILKRKYKARAD